MRYQHSWTDQSLSNVPDENQRNIEKTIQRALELGINHIETARGYGTSERQLGQILPKLPRNEIIVQTKVTPSADPNKFIETFNKSMECLQLEHVDLFSLHGINNDETLEWSMRPGGCLEKAREFQREGRVRFIGFSTHGPCRVIQEAIASGAFDYVNLHWYYINDLNWPAILDAEKQDMGVFIISPNDKGGKLYEPSEKLLRLCQPLSPMQFNDLYCLNRPQVHTLSIGASKPSDFDEHIKALEYYEDIPPVIKPIETRLHEALVNTHGEEWMSGWWKGIPEFEEIPNSMNLLEMLRIYTYVEALDMDAFGKSRYNLFSNGDHWFPGNNATSFDDETLKQALTTSPFCERIPKVLRALHQRLNGESVKRLSKE